MSKANEVQQGLRSDQDTWSDSSLIDNDRAMIVGTQFRITCLTSRLIRLEYHPTGEFVDGPTQLVAARSFPIPELTVSETPEILDVFTDHLHIRYDKRPFSASGLSVKMRSASQGGHATTWHFGDPDDIGDVRPGNLRGTTRTLDDVDGATPLEPGILSINGYAVVDDSTSVVLTSDGWIAPRPAGGTDIYFFGYGRDYQRALQDFFTLTGRSPLLPRWALGNWWSRYHKYTDKSYLDLMDRLKDAGMPFSVAVIDMDWHLVDIDPSLGTGWTGYTWNRELFPDPPAFLRALHDRGLRTTLNVHPADGVRRHETAYAEMARDLGLDPDKGLDIAFDITNRRFVESYLNRLHHPLEDEGVDFWWLDWQSGGVSGVDGLDPLWMLNHIHFHDSARNGKRPITFSRYAGLGSHRYPVGFSGDTIVSWSSLNFQPYFTATAANVGYYWWSHDIGGHLGGVKDNELAARWYQLGVFSPINRLHSSSSNFNSKEPWRYGRRVQEIAREFLQLRHRLVPYLYTGMWQAHTSGTAPIRPMYHDYPWSEDAYRVPNQFMFGPDLLVAPITTPADRATHQGSVDVWLPDGKWYDWFTGRCYTGGRRIGIHRPLESMPVFARAGSVIPLAGDPMADVNSAPEELVLRVFLGGNGNARLIEDDGAAVPSSVQEIRLTLADDGGAVVRSLTLTIDPHNCTGERVVKLEMVGAVPSAEMRVTCDSAALALQSKAARSDSGQTVAIVDLGAVDMSTSTTIRIEGIVEEETQVRRDIFELLDHAEIEYETKEQVLKLVDQYPDPAQLASVLAPLQLPGNLFGALLEIITAG